MFWTMCICNPRWSGICHNSTYLLYYSWMRQKRSFHEKTAHGYLWICHVTTLVRLRYHLISRHRIFASSNFSMKLNSRKGEESFCKCRMGDFLTTHIYEEAPRMLCEGGIFKGFIRFNRGFLVLGISTSFSIFIRGLGMFKTALRDYFWWISFQRLQYTTKKDRVKPSIVLLLKPGQKGRYRIVYLFISGWRKLECRYKVFSNWRDYCFVRGFHFKKRVFKWLNFKALVSEQIVLVNSFKGYQINFQKSMSF